MELFAAIITAALIMGVLDFVWLGFIAKQLYYQEMGAILLQKPRKIAALAFYVIYVLGVVAIVVAPALANDSWLQALAMGGLLGLVAYATYDLTNLATLKDFSKKVVVIDLIWGVFITASVAVGAYFVASLF